MTNVERGCLTIDPGACARILATTRPSDKRVTRAAPPSKETNSALRAIPLAFNLILVSSIGQIAPAKERRRVFDAVTKYLVNMPRVESPEDHWGRWLRLTERLAATRQWDFAPPIRQPSAALVGWWKSERQWQTGNYNNGGTKIWLDRALYGTANPNRPGPNVDHHILHATIAAVAAYETVFKTSATPTGETARFVTAFIREGGVVIKRNNTFSEADRFWQLFSRKKHPYDEDPDEQQLLKSRLITALADEHGSKRAQLRKILMAT